MFCCDANGIASGITVGRDIQCFNQQLKCVFSRFITINRIFQQEKGMDQFYFYYLFPECIT